MAKERCVWCYFNVSHIQLSWSSAIWVESWKDYAGVTNRFFYIFTAVLWLFALYMWMRHSLLWYSMQTLRSFRASRCFRWSFTLLIASMLNTVHSFLLTKVSFQHDIFTFTWKADLYPLQDVLVAELLQQDSITHAEPVSAEVLRYSGTWIMEHEHKVEIIGTQPPGMFTTRRERYTPDLLETSWSWDRKMDDLCPCWTHRVFTDHHEDTPQLVISLQQSQQRLQELTEELISGAVKASFCHFATFVSRFPGFKDVCWTWRQSRARDEHFNGQVISAPFWIKARGEFSNFYTRHSKQGVDLNTLSDPHSSSLSLSWCLLLRVIEMD